MSQRYIDFAFVKTNAAFEPVLAHYNLKLTGSGTQRSVLCPFHRERKPSCKVELDRKIFHCFGCEAKGNILEFVARLEGHQEDLRSAATKIAEICGIATAPPREEHGQQAVQSGARPNHSARERRVTKAWTQPDTGSERVQNDRPKPLSTRPAKQNDREATNSVAEPDAADTPGDSAVINPPLKFQLKLNPTHPYLRARALASND